MYSRSVVRAFLARSAAFKRPAVNSSTVAVYQDKPKPPVEGVMQVREDRIVGRDIVGYGLNGEPQYFDNITFPFPSVRFMKNTPEILVRSIRLVVMAEGKRVASKPHCPNCDAFCLWSRI